MPEALQASHVRWRGGGRVARGWSCTRRCGWLGARGGTARDNAKCPDSRRARSAASRTRPSASASTRTAPRHMSRQSSSISGTRKHKQTPNPNPNDERTWQTDSIVYSLYCTTRTSDGSERTRNAVSQWIMNRSKYLIVEAQSAEAALEPLARVRGIHVRHPELCIEDLRVSSVLPMWASRDRQTSTFPVTNKSCRETIPWAIASRIAAPVWRFPLHSRNIMLCPNDDSRSMPWWQLREFFQFHLK